MNKSKSAEPLNRKTDDRYYCLHACLPTYLPTYLPHDLLFISAVRRVSSEIICYRECNRTVKKYRSENHQRFKARQKALTMYFLVVLIRGLVASNPTHSSLLYLELCYAENYVMSLVSCF